MSDAYPDEPTDAFREYLELNARLEAARNSRGLDPEDRGILAEMDALWARLSAAEREWLEYKSLRDAAASRGDTLARKLAHLWPEAAERRRAEQELARYGEAEEPEVERVRLAILKVCDGRVQRVAELVADAKRGYRDVLMWAEHPAETQATWVLRPNLTAEEQERLAALRADDMRQYWDWIRE